jgi:DNA-binding IclR family transcriptional regulator
MIGRVDGVDAAESPGRPDGVSGVGVLDKAVLILRALRDGPADLAGLQRACGLPRATTHRLVVALEKHHLVRRDAHGRFCPGLELIALGRAAADMLALADLARPELEVLRDESGESVQLFVRDGDARRCVLSLQSPHALRWIVPEGSLLPLDRGSAGRVLAEAHGAVAGADVARWVESVEEREVGVASVSAAVRDATGFIVAAVSISGPVERLTRSPGHRYGAAVAAAADAVGAHLAAAPART